MEKAIRKTLAAFARSEACLIAGRTAIRELYTMIAISRARIAKSKEFLNSIRAGGDAEPSRGDGSHSVAARSDGRSNYWL
jgi:hypothetical protein